LLLFSSKYEQKGKELYQKMADAVRNPRIKKLFEHFVKQEDLHVEQFKDLFKKADVDDGLKEEVPDHLFYLYEFLKKRLFSPELLRDKFLKINDIQSALEFAISFELDSILFYNELKPHVHPDIVPIIDQIVAEERKHFVQVLSLQQDSELQKLIEA